MKTAQSEVATLDLGFAERPWQIAIGTHRSGPRAARTTRSSADPLDRVLAVATLSRLLFIPPLVVAMTRSTVATAALLTAFVLLDVYDGVLGRRRGTDGPSRRALDSIVDRCSIHAVYLAAMAAGLLAPWLFVALLVRDLYCAAICGHMMRERWVAIRADWVYRSLNLALAGWVVVAPLVDWHVAQVLAGAILAWGIVVAADLSRGVMRILADPADLRGVVVGASRLRGTPSGR